MFVCPGCGQVHEVRESGLSPFPALTAAVTTELAVSGPVRYLAVWRLLPNAAAGDDPVWERIRRAAAPGPAYIYVPAFSLARPVVQRIGVRLTEVQPSLQLASGAPAVPACGPPWRRPCPTVSPIAGQSGSRCRRAVLRRRLSRYSSGGERRGDWLISSTWPSKRARPTTFDSADLHLEPGEEELLFLPAVWDPRYIHESNWRLLLREFDGLVA